MSAVEIVMLVVAVIAAGALLLQLFSQIILAQFLTNGSASDCQNTTEIGLHQNANSISAEFRRQAT